MLALAISKETLTNFRVIIAGRIKSNCQAYWGNILRVIEKNDLKGNVIKKIGFIPDREVEIYFKSADVLIVPYKNIFQSGLIFTSYNFGLPVIATDVGSLREDIVEGKTGFVCQPEDPEDLAKKINLYYQSDLFKNLEANRNKIIKYANERFSWERSGDKTYVVYKNLL